MNIPRFSNTAKSCLLLYLLLTLLPGAYNELRAAGPDSAAPQQITQAAEGSLGSSHAIAQKSEALLPPEATETTGPAEQADDQDQLTQHSKQRVFLQALHKKLKLPLPETVRILDMDYPVPEPWAGNRVRVPYDTAGNLALIPPTLTLNGMEIALRKEAIAQLARMAAAAREAGIILLVDSGYRSAAYQRDIYERRLQQGQLFERIARHTAPPGYSSHALGTAVDFHPSSSGFHTTRAYQWLRQHAKNYGFHEVYGKGNRFGMTWEPWHWEYRLQKKQPAEIVVAARKDKTENPVKAADGTQPATKTALEEKANADTTTAQPAPAAAGLPAAGGGQQQEPPPQ